MTPIDFAELARMGDPRAIARLLKADLQQQGVALSIDREGDRLSVGLYADQPLDQAQWVLAISQRIADLNSTVLRFLHLFAYITGNAVPLWSQRIDLTQPLTLQLPTDLDASSPSPSADPAPTENGKIVDRFLVCGLGSLGQYCIYNLKRFAVKDYDVHITAIDAAKPQEWEVEQFTDLLGQEPIMGDCRNETVLLAAGVTECRAILLVTSDESDNIEAAIAARRLNPTIRLVVRSSRQSLNELLKQQLGNFVAFEPTELPAVAFAMAGLQQGILGSFTVGTCRMQVVQQQVQPRDYRFDGISAMTLHKKSYRLVSYAPALAPDATSTPSTAGRAFYQWQPETRVLAGDAIAFVEVVEQVRPTTLAPPKSTLLNRLSHIVETVFQGDVSAKLARSLQWVTSDRNRRLIGISALTALALLVIGVLTLRFGVQAMTWQKAISSGIILLLGGYGDVFGGLPDPAAAPIPWWVEGISLGITLISLIFILSVLGLIADNLLSSRFDFLRRRVPIPEEGHVVLVGLGRVGQRVAALLRDFKQPLVAITEQLDPISVPPTIPLLIGNPIDQLARVNLSTAKSVVVVTDDQMLNLEVALMAREAARQVDRQIGLVIRTYGQRFSNNLVNLLPDAKVLAAYALAGEAFAGAAFGENILGLFRLNDQTILVTEYHVTADDTLVGKLLAQIAYGYGVVPVFLQRADQPLPENMADLLMPSDDRLVHAGDRLILLASMNGLRRIERGEMTPPRCWRLEAQAPLNKSFVHYSGNDLARISGCSLDEARRFMDTLPGSLELLLYDYQAHRLQQELSKQLPLTLQPL